ncbi:glycosyltransferase [Jannaschia sp. W003]|uniref:glycosyltransferase n=1 Tax=Jannaschia sp. W003 TaxID=2867012 RepID=UPI0021A405D0|nr:glycosyltransferase [Jannaschia sp. W003]UWQ22241.1 glycosyltransferase [Jannaschia sp. W003]
MTDAATPPRVLLVSAALSLGPGGMEKTAVNLANHVTRSGGAAALMFRHRPDGKIAYPVDPGVTLLPIDMSPREAARTVERFRPDVVIEFMTGYWFAPVTTAVAATGVPIIAHEGSNPGRILSTMWAEPKLIAPEEAALERAALFAQCARVRFVLEAYRESVPEALRPATVAFPNAFPPADPSDVALRGTEPRRVFLNVGGLKAVKNGLAAVQAFARVASDLPNWDFHMFSGSHGSEVHREIAAFVEAAGLGERVRLFPPTDRIGREYGRSDIHLIASKQEGLPNCVAEAMRHALPSIGFASCPGTNALIVDDRNGLLVPDSGDDAADLAAAMLRAARDDAARARWGAAALEESAMFDPAGVFRRWDAVIAAARADVATPEARLAQRFGTGAEARAVRAVQRLAFGARPLDAAETPGTEITVVVPEARRAEAEALRPRLLPGQRVVLAGAGDGALALPPGADAAGTPPAALDALEGDWLLLAAPGPLPDPALLDRAARAAAEAGAEIATGFPPGDPAETLTHLGRDRSWFAERTLAGRLVSLRFLRQTLARMPEGTARLEDVLATAVAASAERVHLDPALAPAVSSPAPPSVERLALARRLARAAFRGNGLHPEAGAFALHLLERSALPLLRRATRPGAALDPALLEAVRAASEDAGAHLRMLPDHHPGLKLACFALREGYAIWLRPLGAGVRCEGFDPSLLWRGAAERRRIEALAERLRAPGTARTAA